MCWTWSCFLLICVFHVTKSSLFSDNKPHTILHLKCGLLMPKITAEMSYFHLWGNFFPLGLFVKATAEAVIDYMYPRKLSCIKLEIATALC